MITEKIKELVGLAVEKSNMGYRVTIIAHKEHIYMEIVDHKNIYFSDEIMKESTDELQAAIDKIKELN